jgi:outer membrane protein TolC
LGNLSPIFYVFSNAFYPAHVTVGNNPWKRQEIRTLRTTCIVAAVLLAALPARADRTLTLAEAVAVARSRRPEVAEADLEVRLARLGLLRAALERVQLTVGGRWTEQVESGTLDAPAELCRSLPGYCRPEGRARTVEGSASLVVPLWTGFGLEAQWSRARQLERAAQAGKGARLRTITLEVSGAYWTVRWAELLLEAARAALARRAEVASTIKARYGAGITPRGDLNRAETAVLRQHAALVELEGRATQARAELASALQLDEEIALADQPIAAVLPPLAEVLADAERARPELAMASAQVEAQRQQARSLRGAYWPQVQLFARADASNEALGIRQPQLVGNVAAGLLVSWLAFDTLSTFTAARAADLEKDRLAAERERLRFAVRTEVRAAHSRLATALGRRQALTQARALAENTLELIRRRYHAGAALLIEVLEAENELEAVVTDVVGNEIEMALAGASLTAARGGP